VGTEWDAVSGETILFHWGGVIGGAPCDSYKSKVFCYWLAQARKMLKSSVQEIESKQ
jgi:hypothetical protein